GRAGPRAASGLKRKAVGGDGGHRVEEREGASSVASNRSEVTSRFAAPTTRGAESREATTRVTRLGDDRKGDPVHRGQTRVREEVHLPRPPAPSGKPFPGRQGSEDPPEHAGQEDRGVQ